jgi:hypothetical protein
MSEPTSGREWLTEREVCLRFGVSRDTCRRHLRDFALLIGSRTWRYDIQAITRALGPQEADGSTEAL